MHPLMQQQIGLMIRTVWDKATEQERAQPSGACGNERQIGLALSLGNCRARWFEWQNLDSELHTLEEKDYKDKDDGGESEE